MITQRPALSQLPRRVASLAFAALLVLVLPLAAQRSAHGSGGGHSSGGSHGGGGGGGHTAHPSPGGGSGGGGQRQPSSHGHNGGGHGGYYGHGGHGYYGHSYYPYYYPYWGWGWPSFSLSWGYPYYYGYPYGYGYYAGPGYYDGDGYGGGGYDGGYNGGGPMGALDLDVAPGNTHVFVNGQDLGEVDKYDGWPGYLWLPRGTYDVAFYLDGFKTIARQITIYPGNVMDIDDRMEQGQSVRPEDLVTKSHDRRDARIQFERQRSEQIDRQQAYQDDQQQDWHNRVRQDRGDRGDHGPGNVAPAGSRGHLRLSVQPDDSSVYLDGQFVGTGTDLSLLRGGLAVGPGAHHLAVVRPGHKAVEKDFTVQSGEDVQLDVALEAGH